MQYMLVLSIFINLLLIIFSLYFLFFRNYLSQKGKNKATKEDIEVITKKIEEIKSSINIFSIKRQDDFIEFKKSVLDYNKELVIWVEFSIKDISVTTTDPYDKKLIKEKLYNLQFQYSKVQIAYWKVFIYTDKDSEEWFKILWESLGEIMPLHNLTIDYLDSLCEISTKLSLSPV